MAPVWPETAQEKAQGNKSECAKAPKVIHISPMALLLSGHQVCENKFWKRKSAVSLNWINIESANWPSLNCSVGPEVGLHLLQSMLPQSGGAGGLPKCSSETSQKQKYIYVSRALKLMRGEPEATQIFKRGL